ncbi:MAG: ferredoxin reductase [Planctomycetota bacterium]
MLRRAELKVIDIWNETFDTKTFRFAAPAQGLPAFLPGQFYALEVKSPDGTWIRRSYSIASSPRERAHFDLTIKFLEGGAATGVLFKHLNIGDVVRASGPFGEFVLDDTKPAIFIAGGVGVTPMMSMLRYLSEAADPVPVCLIYSNRAQNDIIYEKELREMERKHSNFEFHYSITRPNPELTAWTGRVGRFDAAAIREICKNMTDRIVYLCGPVPMMEEIGRLFITMGVPPEHIKTEAFVGVSPTWGQV